MHTSVLSSLLVLPRLSINIKSLCLSVSVLKFTSYKSVLILDSNILYPSCKFPSFSFFQVHLCELTLLYTNYQLHDKMEKPQIPQNNDLTIHTNQDHTFSNLHEYLPSYVFHQLLELLH